MRIVVVIVGCGLALAACKSRDGATRTTHAARGADATTSPTPGPVAASAPGQRTIGARVAAGVVRGPVPADEYHLLFATVADADRARDASARVLAGAGDAEVAPIALADTMFLPAALPYRGVELTDADRAGLRAATTALRVTVGHAASEPDHLAVDLHLAAAAARAGAGAGHGWIVDPYTSQVFSVASFDDKRPAGFAIGAHRMIIIDAVRDDGGGVFLETLGMARLGLPELYIRGLPSSYRDDVVAIVNAAAQTLIEGGRLPRDGELDVDTAHLATEPWPTRHREVVAAGGTGKVTLGATWSAGDDDHHNANPEIALTIGDGSAVAVADARRAFLGLDADEVIQAARDDAELAAASERALVELAKLAPRFAHGVPDLEQLMVKAPFATDDGGVEWMWVEVHAWRGKRLSGVLANQPFSIAALKEGAEVVVDQDELFDYTHRRADGTSAGGETNAILERQ